MLPTIPFGVCFHMTPITWKFIENYLIYEPRNFLLWTDLLKESAKYFWTLCTRALPRHRTSYTWANPYLTPSQTESVSLQSSWINKPLTNLTTAKVDRDRIHGYLELYLLRNEIRRVEISEDWSIFLSWLSLCSNGYLDRFWTNFLFLSILILLSILIDFVDSYRFRSILLILIDFVQSFRFCLCRLWSVLSIQIDFIDSD